jgi:CRP-like cAMP-binding protein
MAPPSSRAQPGSNRLLDLLPADEQNRLFNELDELTFEQKQRFAHPGEPYTHVVFPTTSVVSMLVPMGEEPPVEAALIGYDGMVGLPVLMGNGRGPYDVVCQSAGRGWSMNSTAFLRVVPSCPRLRQVLQHYALALMNQMARSSACNRMHDLNQRLARWLLLLHDRVPGDELLLTQELLSEMLGVRRPSVSLAAQTLQHAGLIRYQWGHISVLNRRRLEDAACNDYQQTVDEYEQVLGPGALNG